MNLSDFDRAEAFRKFIEIKVLEVLKDVVQKERENSETIKQLAQRCLDLIKPGMTLEELYKNAVQLDDRHPELAPVVVSIMQEYEQRYEKRALDEVSKLVKAKKFDEAQSMVKKVLEFKRLN